MATPFQWLPRQNGTGRRGLELNAAGQVTWAFLPSTQKRQTTLFLNRPARQADVTISRRIVRVIPSTRSRGGRYPVSIEPTGTGTTEVTVGGATLKLLISARSAMRVAFYNVTNDAAGTANDWTTNFTVAKAEEMLSVAQAIFSWQGNVSFTMTGPPLRSTSAMQDVATSFTGGQLASQYKTHAASDANVTTFFINKYGGSGWAAQNGKAIVMDNSIDTRIYGLVFAHELGHFMSLPHPTGSVQKNNLMNQTGVAATYGGRRRFRSYLNRTQIEKVVSACNWEDQTGSVCSI